LNTPERQKRQPLFHLLNILIVLLIIGGLYLILYPYYVHWRQDSLTKDLQDAFNQGDGTILIDPDALAVAGEDVDYGDLSEGGETTGSTAAGSETSSETTVNSGTQASSEPTPTVTPKPLPAKIVVKAIGQIKIPVINLNMPIAEGATIYNLRVAISRYSNGAGIGQPGQCVLFGHRMYTYGRHFNRLDEVKAGDQIILEDKANRYTYEVDLIETILPEELISHLNDQFEESRILLVTCTPIRVASHRLLVKGKLVSTEPLG